MNYKDVLDKYKENLPNNRKWWPNFLYHFTDVHNASRILCDGYIWSRQKAEEKKIMANDNASHAVIESTDQDNKCYGRLYFRPLTPTQFHNEGYKPKEVRNLDASCPVPIFLCLSANAILEFPGTKFAEKGLSGRRHDIKSGVEEFEKLNFRKIYHDGYYTSEESDIKEYRHSEVIHENGFPVEPFLKGILCRSEAERETLLFLLGQYSMRLYNTYKSKIIYNPKLHCFYHNGIYIKRVNVLGNKMRIEFNDPELRKLSPTKEPIDLKIQIEISYRLINGQVLEVVMGEGNLDYNSVRSCEIKLQNGFEYDVIRIKVAIDEISMYENEISMEEALIF